MHWDHFPNAPDDRFLWSSNCHTLHTRGTTVRERPIFDICRGVVAGPLDGSWWRGDVPRSVINLCYARSTNVRSLGPDNRVRLPEANNCRCTKVRKKEVPTQSSFMNRVRSLGDFIQSTDQDTTQIGVSRILGSIQITTIQYIISLYLFIPSQSINPGLGGNNKER